MLYDDDVNRYRNVEDVSGFTLCYNKCQDDPDCDGFLLLGESFDCWLFDTIYGVTSILSNFSYTTCSNLNPTNNWYVFSISPPVVYGHAGNTCTGDTNSITTKSQCHLAAVSFGLPFITTGAREWNCAGYRRGCVGLTNIYAAQWSIESICPGYDSLTPSPSVHAVTWVYGGFCGPCTEQLWSMCTCVEECAV